MIIEMIILGVVVVAVGLIVTRHGEIFDRVNKKEIDAHISVHHKETENQRRH